MKNLIFFILIVISSHINAQIRFDQSKNLNKAFASNELAFLKKIHNLFFNSICIKPIKKSKDYSKCYEDYVSSFSNLAAESDTIQIPLVSRDHFNLLLDSNSNKLKELIWTIQVDYQNNSFDQLLINNNSRFFKLLKSSIPTKPIYPFIRNKKIGKIILVKEYEKSQNPGPNCYFHPLNNPEKYDLSDIEVRLLIAINYLTLLYNNQ